MNQEQILSSIEEEDLYYKRGEAVGCESFLFTHRMDPKKGATVELTFPTHNDKGRELLPHKTPPQTPTLPHKHTHLRLEQSTTW